MEIIFLAMIMGSLWLLKWCLIIFVVASGLSFILSIL